MPPLPPLEPLTYPLHINTCEATIALSAADYNNYYNNKYNTTNPTTMTTTTTTTTTDFATTTTTDFATTTTITTTTPVLVVVKQEVRMVSGVSPMPAHSIVEKELLEDADVVAAEGAPAVGGSPLVGATGASVGGAVEGREGGEMWSGVWKPPSTPTNYFEDTTYANANATTLRRPLPPLPPLPLMLALPTQSQLDSGPSGPAPSLPQQDWYPKFVHTAIHTLPPTEPDFMDPLSNGSGIQRCTVCQQYLLHNMFHQGVKHYHPWLDDQCISCRKGYTEESSAAYIDENGDLVLFQSLAESIGESVSVPDNTATDGYASSPSPSAPRLACAQPTAPQFTLADYPLPMYASETYAPRSVKPYTRVPDEIPEYNQRVAKREITTEEERRFVDLRSQGQAMPARPYGGVDAVTVKGSSVARAAKDEEDLNHLIKCVCGVQQEDGFMINCDGCGFWQHGCATRTSY
jgi:hypothetical protein